MTSVVVSLALLLTPSPITAPHSLPGGQQSGPVVARGDTALPDWIDTTLIFTFTKDTSWPAVISAPSTPTPTNSSSPPTEKAPSLFVETPPVALTVSSDTPKSDIAPPTVTPPPPTLRDRVLTKLADLGAPQWVINGFDCVGWFESKWQNVRSRTGDTGVLQLNDVHSPELRRLGLDPWVPEDAATFSWLLFTRAGWSFRDWTVRGLCGLR